MSPHYLTIGPNPNLAVSLIRLIDHGFGTHTSLEGMQDHITEFDEKIREVMEESPEASSYVHQLEEQFDANRPPLPAISEETPKGELPPTEDLLSDLEQFLKRQRGEDG